MYKLWEDKAKIRKLGDNRKLRSSKDLRNIKMPSNVENMEK